MVMENVVCFQSLLEIELDDLKKSLTKYIIFCLASALQIASVSLYSVYDQRVSLPV